MMKASELAVHAAVAILFVASSAAQQRPNPEEVTPKSLDVTAAKVRKVLKRGYYVTSANHTSSEVLTSCANGYHTASLWELTDVASLTYHHNHPAAYTRDDSGYGPPGLWYGWMRTGTSSSGTNTVGTANCLNWTSTSASDSGTIARLSPTAGSVGPWEVTTWSCSGNAPVWCVSDKK